jgi:uncharacterized protein YacL
MKWINIIGLCLQFLAFWFAAPELLGVDALKRFEKSLIKLISKMPSLILGIAGLVLGLSMGIYGINQGLSASDGQESNMVATMLVIISISVIYMLYILFFYKKVQRWIEKSFAKPIITKLISNNESRKIALITGAFLFTLGFVFQILVALWS